MKQQLSFHIDLLFSNKKAMRFYGGLTILYVVLGIFSYQLSSTVPVMLTLLYTLFLGFGILKMIELHNNNNNYYMNSNFRRCRYFPTKVSYYCLSRIILLIGTLLLIEVIAALTYFLSKAIFPKNKTMIPIISIIALVFMLIAMIASVTAISLIHSISFMITRMVCGLCIGAFAGGFMSVIDNSKEQFSVKAYVLMFSIFAVLWGVCETVGYFIAKKITV